MGAAARRRLAYQVVGKTDCGGGPGRCRDDLRGNSGIQFSCDLEDGLAGHVG